KIVVKNSSDENTDIAFNDINENSSYQAADVSSSAVMGIGPYIQLMRAVAKIVAKSYKAAPKGKIAKETAKASSELSKITPKIAKQMERRGWTKESIHETVNNAYTSRTAANRATNNPATAYFRKDGSYV